MRIWKYLDLAKLVSMLSSKALYFAPPSELNDPYEGYLPRSHVEAHEEIAHNILAQFKNTRDQIVERFPDRDRAVLERDEIRFGHIRRFRSNLRTRPTRRCRGSDRWHCRRPRWFAVRRCATNV